MIGRENIFTSLVTIMKTVPGVKVVARANVFALIEQLKEYPAIVISDFGSKVEEVRFGKKVGTVNQSISKIGWVTSFALVPVVSSSTIVQVAADLSTFGQSVTKILYQRIGECSEVTFMTPAGITSIYYPKSGGGKVGYQGLRYEVKHIEDISALIM